MNRDMLKSKITGCLMAGALGDALGYEIEFDTWSGIQQEYGPRGIRKLALHGGKARISDDTQMTLFTNEALVLGSRAKANGDPAEAEYFIWQSYLCWLKTQYPGASRIRTMWDKSSELLTEPELNVRRAPGNTCLSALSTEEMGTIEEPLNHSKGCGGVMRSAPVGFSNQWGEPLIKGAASGAITHGHPGGWAPAGMLSDIIYRILYGEKKPLEEIVKESMQAVEDAWDRVSPSVGKFLDMVREAIRLSHTDVPDVDAIHSLGGGWVGDEALAIAVYCSLKHSDDIIAALISGVNHSGDSDSTGAIVGNILGAYHGIEAVPQEWIDQLELVDVILRQADQMAEVIRL